MVFKIINGKHLVNRQTDEQTDIQKNGRTDRLRQHRCGVYLVGRCTAVVLEERVKKEILTNLIHVFCFVVFCDTLKYYGIYISCAPTMYLSICGGVSRLMYVSTCINVALILFLFYNRSVALITYVQSTLVNPDTVPEIYFLLSEISVVMLHHLCVFYVEHVSKQTF